MSSGAQAQATTAIAKAAHRLHQEAKGHMRLANQHRRRAATLYAEVEELQRTCLHLGIQLDLTPPQTMNAQGGTDGDRSTTRDED
jgi:hypothetical protein